MIVMESCLVWERSDSRLFRQLGPIWAVLFSLALGSSASANSQQGLPLPKPHTCHTPRPRQLLHSSQSNGCSTVVADA